MTTRQDIVSSIYMYLGITKVKVDGLCMSDVQDAVGLRGKPGDNLEAGDTCTV